MRFLPALLLSFLTLLLLPACKPMPNDGIPFYLKIDSVSVEGGKTNHITDIWAEANTTTLGPYELPCNFPVLEEGEVKMVLNAGIQESGQAGVRVTYPFYLPDTFTLSASRAETYPRSPVFKYRGAANIPVDEDFESGNGFAGAFRLTIDPNIQYGLACAKVAVSTIDSSEEAKQIAAYSLPAGQEIWLEIDYKTDVPFYIGFYANYIGSSSLRVPYLFVTASNEWNKIYVKLSNVVGSYRADTYQLYFEALRPYGSSGGSLYFDNVRLVHF